MEAANGHSRIGSSVDTYRIVALLGRGGMGAVFKAVHRWTDREVAIKFLHPYLGGDEQNIRRFMKEARAATALRHPNVVDVLHMGEHSGEVYLVMELLRGRSLREHLREHQRLSEAEALKLILPVMDALAHGHALGITHRDIKPDNIFIVQSIGGSSLPKLLDFGVAKLADPAGSSSTVTGALLGTPQYMSPEQANGESDVGPATDVWAIGMVLYECLTGSLPFRQCAALPALLLKLVAEDVPTVMIERPDLSEHVARAVDTALRRDRAERFASMAEFASELRRSTQDASHADTLPAVHARGLGDGRLARVNPIVLGIAAVLVLSAALYYWSLSGLQPTVADDRPAGTETALSAVLEAGRLAVEPATSAPLQDLRLEPEAISAGAPALPVEETKPTAASKLRPLIRRVERSPRSERPPALVEPTAVSVPPVAEPMRSRANTEPERPPEVVEEY